MPPVAFANAPNGETRLPHCLAKGTNALVGFGPPQQDLRSPCHTDWRFACLEELMQEFLILGLQLELAGFSASHCAFSRL
jgi:hypothetical protein